jgi:putative glutamine amidotransferase
VKHRTRWIVIGLPAILVVIVLASFGGFRIWLACSLPSTAPAIAMTADSSVFNELGMTSATYETAIVMAGGRPRVVRAGDDVDVEALLDSVSGLYLTGGGDVDPAIWGGDPEGTLLLNPGRDELEIALVRGALARAMPVLGICRGAQVINVAMGGTLRVIRTDGDLGRTHYVSLDSFSAHPVHIEPGTRLMTILDQETRQVNSFHGNSVDSLAEGLRISARAPDGVVEAIEAVDERYILGIQWHPDLRVTHDPDALAIFESFVDAARDYVRP